MATCGEGTCSCLVRGGAGILVSGGGTQQNPYIIAMDNPGLSDSLQINDTDSINLTLLGAGTPLDPFILSGVATVKMTQLVDIQDPEGGPSAGEVPTFVGSGGTGHFEFKTPPPAPAGSVNVGQGLGGVGSALDPIYVKTVGAAGGPTTGLEVYVDSAGNLRATPQTATAVDWSTITGKPSTFPPSAHNQAATTITVTTSGMSNLQVLLNSMLNDIIGVESGVASLNTKVNSGTVYDSARVGGNKIFSGSSTPSGPTTNDLWFRAK